MKKNIRVLIVGLLLASTLVVPAFAAVPSLSQDALSSQASSGDITPYKDELIMYYRIHNGVTQYRIWNATRGYWVNDWTNLPQS